MTALRPFLFSLSLRHFYGPDLQVDRHTESPRKHRSVLLLHINEDRRERGRGESSGWENKIADC